MSKGVKQIRVSPNKSRGGRDVHKAGASRDIAHEDRKSDARAIARRVAINQWLEMIEQKKNGQIDSRNSYGQDPFPPKW